LAGKPLIVHTAELLKLLPEVDQSVVSTDSAEIAGIAERHGLHAPFLRPDELGGDRVADWDVLNHALRAMENIDHCAYDVILMLQPTCPMRTAAHVQQTFRKLVDGGYDAVWTLTATDSKAHPLKQLVLNGDMMDYYDPRGADIIARQQLTPVYHRNGAAYAITRACLLDQKSIKGERCSAVVIADPLANIDTVSDLAYAEYLIRNKA
jgi:CMP-N-acetylneuraminic acid synthetase